MGALEVLVRDILLEAGLDQVDVRTRTGLELPGYYRPEKKWDLLVVSRGQLVLAVEFKSQVGPSFGNNANNRAEEAVGNATDIWTAYREKRFGEFPAPFVGYFFLLEDCPEVHKPVANVEPYFRVDPEFARASYARRYQVLCERLMLERLYNGCCLTLSTRAGPDQTTVISHPSPSLAFSRFAAAIDAHARFFRTALQQ